MAKAVKKIKITIGENGIEGQENKKAAGASLRSAIEIMNRVQKKPRLPRKFKKAFIKRYGREMFEVGFGA